MASICGYMATSLDGYIADAGGGISWLKPFDSVEFGYERFIAGIDTVVMGRGTFDQLLSFDAGWLYAGKRGLIVTSRPLAAAPAGVTAWRHGVPALIAELRARDGAAWVVGGAGLQADFLAAGAIDRLELFIIPVLLGNGVRLFPPDSLDPLQLVLRESEALPLGMVRLAYEVTGPLTLAG
ncbi:dihydrofolate reductase family protein [Ancylobacter sp. Lp-2]|uniref:dihydrofolate reductase family protein n=1 Tax=Ancylobacter sp. Lp-2 TaxID=2881339 RepID=UPI001E3C03E6|nr:dihydrofolate reductase family protein [Ancylobacter sp. Lp-2]MCB4769435.1 dihydrofolate reductase family protein [Ancylobacter sp. Lp-2]